MQLVDLSLSLNNETPVFPGDPKVNIRPFKIDNDGTSIHEYYFSGHTGTHIDAPSHFYPKGKNHSDIPIEKYTGKGILIDARERKLIDKDVLNSINIDKDTIVLFWTDWVKKNHQQDYYTEYPVISNVLADELVRLKVNIVGIDFPNPDKPPYSVHKILLKGEVLIIENLCNLDKLQGKRFKIFAFPLKVDTDGIPVRVVGEIL